MSMLNELRNLTVDRMSMDEALALSAFGASLASEYSAHQLDSPTWLTENLAVLGREIQDRRRDELRRQLKEAQVGMERLKTADEKRADLRAKIDRLNQQLGVANPAEATTGTSEG